VQESQPNVFGCKKVSKELAGSEKESQPKVFGCKKVNQKCLGARKSLDRKKKVNRMCSGARESTEGVWMRESQQKKFWCKKVNKRCFGARESTEGVWMRESQLGARVTEELTGSEKLSNGRRIAGRLARSKESDVERRNRLRRCVRECNQIVKLRRCVGINGLCNFKFD
jgi:hypothetical protein